METDILLLDGTLRRLEGTHKVRVDIAQLSWMELTHLRSAVDSAFELRQRDCGGGRCWIVPAAAVEVFVAK